MEQEKAFLEEEMLVDEVCLRVSFLHSSGMLENRENRLQERTSSEEPPVLVQVADAEDAEDAADIVGAAAKIPKIEHQMWAMTQFFSTWASEGPNRYYIETIYRERTTNTTRSVCILFLL